MKKVSGSFGVTLVSSKAPPQRKGAPPLVDRGEWVGKLGEKAKTEVEDEAQLNISQQGVRQTRLTN